MKRRIRKIANFFAFNLLFFALYLNFIHQDNNGVPGAGNISVKQNTAAFSNSVTVANPEQVLQTNNQATVVMEQPVVKEPLDDSKPLKLSIN